MNTTLFSRLFVSERFSKLSILMIIAISLLGIMYWFFDLGFISNVSEPENLTAPSTAFIFITLAIGLWFYLLPQEKALNKYIALASSIFVIILSCLFVVTFLYQYSLSLNPMSYKIGGSSINSQLWSISYIEAILMMFGGLSLFFLLSTRKLFKSVSIVFAIILFLTSSTLILAYVLGAPFFQVDNYSQVSFFTALSFLFVSIALITVSERNTFLIKIIWEDSTNAKLLRMFLPIALLITVLKSIFTIYVLPLIDMHPAIFTLSSSVIIIVVIITAIIFFSKKLGLSLDTALNSLKESQGKYQTMIETSNDIIWILDQKGYFTFLNPQAEKATGLSLKDVLGKSFTPFVLEEELAFLTEVFEKTMKGESISYEMSLKTVTGNTIVLAVNTAPLYTNGEVQGMFSFGHDITKRKDAQRLLKESETRFKALHNASFGGIAIHDQGIIKDCNQGLSDITGYTFEELIGMDGLLCIAENSRAIVKENIKTSYDKAYEVVGLRKNGEEFPLRLEGKKIPFEGKNMRVVEFRDISERIKTENNVRRLSTAVNQSPSVIVITDTQGKLEYVNPKFTELTGYTEFEVIGKEASLLKSGEQAAAFYKSMWETIESGKVWRGQFHNKKKNGDLFWESASISAIKNDSGKIINFIKIGEDITELKQAEANLLQSTQLMEASQSISKVGGWELNLKTNALFWTAETYRIHDTKPESFNPTVESGVDYYMPESRSTISEALNAAIEEGKDYDLVLETRTAKGRQINVRTTCKVTFKDGKPVKLTGIFQDITEQINNEERLKKALNKALESDQLKSAFLANMSHEIRTPMNGILGFMNLLNQPDLTKDETDQYTKIINKSGERLLSTINDIIDISKIEAGEMNLSKTEILVNNIVEEVYAFHSPEATEKGIALIMVDSDTTEELNINTDSQKLHGILTNLIKNAIKYTDRGYVKFSFLKKESFVEFTVEDSGVGIPEYRIHAIFNRFEQADIGDARVYEGSGLGLTISMAYAKMLGGDIRVESERGQGSKFICTIPVV